MLKIVIGNKAYSSWSLRGWLAVKQSGLPFEEVVFPLYDGAWDARKASEPLLGSPSRGQVPILWDGDVAVWDSLAIVDWLADRVGREAYWPLDDAARALARSMCAEMHSGYQALRNECGMNLRRQFPGFALSDATRADVDRIDALWTLARTRFGRHGAYLFGAFGAADIMFSAVVTRFTSYDVALSDTARAYAATMTANPWMIEWVEGAKAESWVIDRFEL